MTFPLTQKLNSPLAELWLQSLGISDSKGVLSNLRQIGDVDLESSESTSLRFEPMQFESFLTQFSTQLHALGDPERASNNLERLAATHSQIFVDLVAAPGQFEKILVLFSESQSLSDHLIRVPEDFQFIEDTQGKRFTRDNLVDQLWTELQNDVSQKEAMVTLRRFKHRETLRIAVGDLVLGHRLEQVTQQISYLASASVEAAYLWLRNHLVAKFGQPINGEGAPSRFVILAMGKLGGMELNYSSDIDLVMVFESHGTTDGGGFNREQKISNEEFFARLCREFGKLLSETTELGFAYRVDLRLRPNGSSGRICNSIQSMLQYYDLQGRTWERQALVKASPIAGDLELGQELLGKLSPWIYHRNLSRADITGIKGLKRKIEKRTLVSGEDKTNVKTGHGGIRDVEFVIQFMQLLNGGEIPEVRTTNTLDAIRRLEKAKCLSAAEATVLAQNYEWLRKLEHRLQIMFDLQTHTIPTDKIELEKIAKRMGFVTEDSNSSLQQFERTLAETTESNRKILNHLLHNAFGAAFGSLRDTGGNQYRFDNDEVPPEVDLILDPDPDPEFVSQVLTQHGFRKVSSAYQNLMELAKEQTRFLSSRRCKHFLASVAPTLLSELAQTPDPDASLTTLATVSDCLGAKGVLWELFSFNPPTLSLYVRLCASSDYLVGILKSNPGMIDELVDALQLDGLPTPEWLAANVEELTKGADDLTPIIHSFKNTQHMRVGIRDILGRDDVRDTHLALSNIAEVCLKTAARHQFQQLVLKHALPDKVAEIDGLESPFVILGLGKLGGREPNYHSDLDVIFLYDSDPEAMSAFETCLKDGTTCQFFFSELAAGITRFVGHSLSHGKLYEIDSRLRPTGKSGSLAVSMDEFRRYFESGKGQTWERQALCKARPLFGSDENCRRSMELVLAAIAQQDWVPETASEIRAMRMSMQKGSTEQNLKRGVGGTVDVEFIVQMLQLKHVRDDGSVLVPGTREAVERLKDSGFLDEKHAKQLADGYQLLRSVEARLRLMNTTSRHDLPVNEVQLSKLAYLLNYASAKELGDAVDRQRQTIRQLFDLIVC